MNNDLEIPAKQNLTTSPIKTQNNDGSNLWRNFMSSTFQCSAQEFMIHSFIQDRKKIFVQKSVEIVRIVDCIHKYKVYLSNTNTRYIHKH